MRTASGIVLGAFLAFGHELPRPAPNDAAAIVERMAANLERAAELQKEYVYDRTVATAVWTSGSRLPLRTERRRYIISGVYGSVMRSDAFQGDCLTGPRKPDRREGLTLQDRVREYHNETYTQPGFPCPGIDGAACGFARIADDLLDDGTSLDGIPYWLLPLRPANLKFFRFTLHGETVYDGRRVYIIDFKPAHGASRRASADDRRRAAHAWQGTLWVDAEEAQLARVLTRVNSAIGPYPRASFEIAYKRVVKDVWFPAAYCNVLWGGSAIGKVSFESSGFRKVDVYSQLEYVFSTIRFH